jgi:hypothetical protein
VVLEKIGLRSKVYGPGHIEIASNGAVRFCGEATTSAGQLPPSARERGRAREPRAHIPYRAFTWCVVAVWLFGLNFFSRGSPNPKRPWVYT